MIDLPWTNGYVVLSGITGGQRVALSNSQRVMFRPKRNLQIEFDRDFALPAVISGMDAAIDLLDEDCALVARLNLSHCVARGESLEITQ